MIMKKVLIVDDTKNIRIMLTACLEMRGYDIITAENGQIALHLIENDGEGIDLVFLDIRMPSMNGTEVLKAIRSKGIKCTVIIMTAFATIKNAVDCTKLGAAAYLQKPFSPDRINSLLDEIERTGDIKNSVKQKSDDNNYITNAKKLINGENYNEAFNNVKLALSINPYDKEAYYLISKINEKQNNMNQAIRFYKIFRLFDE